MRIHIFAGLVFGAVMASVQSGAALAQGGEPPSLEQAIQNNTRMLTSVHSNPKARSRALARLKERLEERGVADADARLAKEGEVLDEAAAMSDEDFQKNLRRLAMKIIAQMRPEGECPPPEAPGETALAARPSAGPATESSGSVPWIDVHDHLLAGRDHDFDGAANAALAIMDQIGISQMILMPPPQNSPRFDIDAFKTALASHPGRFAFLGGGESLNVMLQQTADQTSVSEDLRKQFTEKAEELLRQGASGFGEMAAHHLSLHGADHPYESVPADHPLLLLLADIAARHDVPIDIHFDVVAKDIPTPAALNSPNNPKTLRANLAAFERLLDHNPKARICWAHAGSDNTGHWTAALTRRMLQKHPNLYMSLRLGPGNAPENFPLTPDWKIKPEWYRLFKDFPTRFVIGGDNFIASASFKGSGTAAELAKRVPMTRQTTPALLNALPAELSHKLAYENAVALYKLAQPETK